MTIQAPLYVNLQSIILLANFVGLLVPGLWFSYSIFVVCFTIISLIGEYSAMVLILSYHWECYAGLGFGFVMIAIMKLLKRITFYDMEIWDKILEVGIEGVGAIAENITKRFKSRKTVSSILTNEKYGTKQKGTGLNMNHNVLFKKNYMILNILWGSSIFLCLIGGFLGVHFMFYYVGPKKAYFASIIAIGFVEGLIMFITTLIIWLTYKESKIPHLGVPDLILFSIQPFTYTIVMVIGFYWWFQNPYYAFWATTERATVGFGLLVYIVILAIEVGILKLLPYFIYLIAGRSFDPRLLMYGLYEKEKEIETTTTRSNFKIYKNENNPNIEEVTSLLKKK